MKIIVAVTGASGSIYADVLLKTLSGYAGSGHEISLIFSETATKVWEYELGNKLWQDFGFTRYSNTDLFAPPASGSAAYDAMIAIPCSAGTLARMAAGTADNLICRAADVMLKERKKLVLVLRETPFSLIHIQNMERLTLAGAMIFPACPSFYSRPQSVEDVVKTVTNRVLETIGIKTDLKRWGEI